MWGLREWLDAVAAQQDYAWFLSALAWSCVTVLAWTLHRRGRTFDWVLGVAVAGLGIALCEMAMHASPPADFHAPRLGWDLALGLLHGGAIAALVWSALGTMKGTLVRQVLAVVVVGALAYWRQREPYVGGLLLGLIGVVAGWPLVRRIRTQAAHESVAMARLPLLAFAPVLVALLPVFSTIGPVAKLANQERRWTELSALALPSLALQLGAAGLVAVALWRWRPGRGTVPVPAAVRRESSWLVAAVAVWLAAGLGFAILSARAARQNFESMALARTRTAAAMLDADAIAGCFGPGLELQESVVAHQPGGIAINMRRVPALRNPEFMVHKKLLTKLGRANPEARYVQVATVRRGQLLGVIFRDSIPGRGNLVVIHRETHAEDLLAWADKREVFDAPFSGPWGELVRARAPLVTTGGRMVGWFCLDWGVSDWAASQAQARLQMFAVIFAGVVLAVLYAVQRDRTRQRAEAQQAAERARASDQAKTAFLAKVSHELRTPIQSILGYGELLATVSLEEPQRGWLGSLRTHGNLLIRLVNDLIDLGAMQAGAFRLTPQPVDLVALVSDTVNSLRPRASAKGLCLECEFAPDVAAIVNADPERLRQVLFNLVGNAVKFTAQGGVRVELRRTAAPSSAQAEREWYALLVSDTGPGIAPEDQIKLFQPFVRLDPTAGHEGAGLGLALAAAFCRAMKGELHCESDGLHGTTFLATLPLAPIAGAQMESSPRRAHASLRGLRVLVADDNTLVRELFTAYLAAEGAMCTAVSDGLAAVDACREHRYDALVLDISMPWADGFEVARRLRATGAQCPRIVGVSAHADPMEKARALAGGMDAFLVKPVSLQALGAALLPGEGAPVAGAASVRFDVGMARRLQRQFDAELPPILAALEQALIAADWPRLKSQAHYLKNSADVLDWPELRAACTALEAAAGDPAGASVAFRQLRALTDKLFSPAISAEEIKT